MERKKVLFLWPPQSMFYGSLFKHITHVGETLDYVIKHTDSDIEFIDAGIEMFNIKMFVEKFKTIDYLIVYCEVYTIESSIKIAKMAKQINKHIKIMGYGKACCYLPNHYVQNGYYDAVVTNGFWEKPIVDFINETPIMDTSQYYIKNGYVGELSNIEPNEWGIPKIELLPLEKYFALTGKRQLEICVNKGCPYNCSFCSEKFVYGKEEGRRSVESLIEYVEKTHHLCDSYYFDATTFTYDEKWVEDMCNAVNKLPYKIKWCSVTRLDELDDRLIKLMAESGCYRLSVGVETLNNETQQLINKTINFEHMINIFKKLKDNGIVPRALLMIGLPNQTKEEILKTFHLLKEMQLDIRFKEYAPYNEILKDGVSDDVIRSFDRTEYYNNNKIDGLDCEMYMQLIFEDKGR